MVNTKVVSNKFQSVIAVLIGALLMGFLWRVRGETGWGSSWGLLNAGFVFLLFVVLLVGNRQKMKFGWIGLTAASFMLTVPSWGTLLYQTCGVLYSSELHWQKGMDVVEIPVASGVAIMLSLGFGLATVFGVMLGRGLSEKQWKITDFIIVIAVFYAFNLLAKATVSHWILELIQPQAAQVYAQKLAEAGQDGSVYHIYMQHFDNLSWAKKIDGGRNYFSEIQAISSVISSIAVILATRFIVKDKRAARTGLVVSIAFAVAITVADIFFFLSHGGYHMQNDNLLPNGFSAWVLWEYFTGFIAGGIITAYIIKLKPAEDVPELALAKIPDKAKTVLTFLIGFVFAFGVNIARPIMERGECIENETLGIILAIVVAVAVTIPTAFKCGFGMEKTTMTKFASIAFPSFVIFIFVLYTFFQTFEKFEKEFLSGFSVINILLVISFVAILVWSLVNRKKAK